VKKWRKKESTLFCLSNQTIQASFPKNGVELVIDRQGKILNLMDSYSQSCQQLVLSELKHESEASKYLRQAKELMLNHCV
jgi:hypothetical protein